MIIPFSLNPLILSLAISAGGLVIGGQFAAQTPSGQNAPETFVSVSQAPVPKDEGERAQSIPLAALTEVVQRNCVTCHNDALLRGNLSLQDFAVERAAARAETAEKMIRKLRAGMMPPPEMPRPGGDTLRVLAETLESTIDQAARAVAPDLGVRRFQRLSEAEYERSIGELLALEVDAGQWLPPDILVGSFDNASAGQRLSTTLLEGFVRAASEISRLAVGDPRAVSRTTEYKSPPELSQHAWDRLEGAPYGTRGGIVVMHNFPADGEYVFQIETSFGEGTRVFQDVDISVAGEPVALLELSLPGQSGGIYDDGGEVFETEPVFVRAGQQRVSAAFVRRIAGPYEDRLNPPEGSIAGTHGGGRYGATVLPHIAKVNIKGPRNITGLSQTESRRKIFTCHPSSGAEARPCAKSIFKRLARQAFRRPVTDGDADLADIMEFYDGAVAEEGFEVGVRAGLQVILSSPEFVFRLEREPRDALDDGYYQLRDVDLASRLSFFLWATGPDEELLEVAESGRLSDPGVLEQQVRRMLVDPRSEALATRFAHQWLRLQDVGAEVWPEPFLYPDFSQQLANSMVRETELFFNYLVQENRSFLELFAADYTFLNERLARHYGIDGIYGEQFRRVKYPTERRRGIFGHGSVLLLTSMSARTSPVERGKWVMEVLMGTPPPPPPPNVPAFEASPDAREGRLLTTRERMELHRTNPVCQSCHRFIDPIGLALDNFDVTGKWRIRENKVPLDTRGEFYTGTQISTPNELAEVLLERPVPLVRNFAERLLSYAIGRPIQYLDQPTIRAIEKEAKANDYSARSLIIGVVKSDAFQMKMHSR